jgi:hypothetical protein
MKTFKIYLALFAMFLAFNGSLAGKLSKLRQEPDAAQVANPVSNNDSNNDNNNKDNNAPIVNNPNPGNPLNANNVLATNPEEGNENPTKFGTFFPSVTEHLPVFTELSNDICFSDLGVNSEGIIIGVGLDNNLYEYAFAENVFVALKTEYEISNLWRVDINYDGIIFVITRCGDTFYLDCKRRWVKLPGCAIDIGAGRSGEIYKIGCDSPSLCGAPIVPGTSVRPSSPHVYKLICTCNCKCCDRRCKVFIKHYHYKTCEPAEIRVCHWIKLPVLKVGGVAVKFTRIDAKFTGHPITTDGDRTVYEFFGGDENVFKPIYQAPSIFSDINDIASDNYGNDFYSTNFASYIITGASSETRIVNSLGLSRPASDISVGPYGMISFIRTTDRHMYTVAIINGVNN